MARKNTIATALAYVAITDSKRCLHIDTRIALIDYVSYKKDWQPGERFLVVNEKGMELARTSRLWKAHERLTSLGFEVDRSRAVRPALIVYRSAKQVETKYGPRTPTAFTGKRGDVYADVLNAEGYLSPTLI